MRSAQRQVELKRLNYSETGCFVIQDHHLIVPCTYMSTLRHPYGHSVILASLKTSAPETKSSVI